MKLKEKIDKFYKKFDEILTGNEYNSPLNPFILCYYTSLKEEDLEETKEGVIFKIEENNEIIQKLKEEISTENIIEIHKEIVNKYISDLEYQNTTSEEIVRVIELRKEKFLNKKLKKKSFNLFKRNTKIPNCQRLK